jgi:hypothetical protein
MSNKKLTRWEAKDRLGLVSDNVSQDQIKQAFAVAVALGKHPIEQLREAVRRLS